MKEAAYYHTKGNIIVCDLCPNNCHISVGKVGSCRVRENIAGKLAAKTYGYISALAIDPIEKKPLHLFHPGEDILSIGTYGCNFHCSHCQNHHISQTKVATSSKLTPENIVELARKNNLKLVAFTYNEPLIWYEYILESAKLLQAANLKTVLVTNGYINRKPLLKIIPYIDAFSLDIKGFYDKSAKTLAKVKSFKQVYQNAETIFQTGTHLEITTNIVPKINDTEQELQEIAKFIAIKLSTTTAWHISRAFPNYKLSTIKPTPIATLQKAKDIGTNQGLTNIFLGNI